MIGHRYHSPLSLRRRLIVAAFFLSCALFPLQGRSFVRLGSSGLVFFWAEAQATLNLQFGCPASALPYWGPCWDDAAADAAERWNETAVRFRFSRQTPPLVASPCAHSDGLNTAGFQSMICGTAFGSSTLAITISFANANGVLRESDVLLNAGRQWSTYPGPLQPPFIDFHRVVMHEFGHVLGLGHPDQAGQNVTAIMNSTISHIDTLRSDDIAGVNTIYPSAIASLAHLENPQPDASVSGINLISGWACDAGRIDVLIDGTIAETAAYGTLRTDTLSVCGDDNNGFGLLINWNRIGSGLHTIVVFQDGVEFARRTFTVTTLGQEFLRGASGTYSLNFVGRNVFVQWDEALQNFVIVGVQ